MNRFAALLDRLVYEPRRNAKLRLLVDYFSHTPDPDRGFALAAMTGALTFREAKPISSAGLPKSASIECCFACRAIMWATSRRRPR